MTTYLSYVLHTSAYSMGNRQEELEVCAWLESYSVIGMRETWKDSSHDWSAGMDRYRFFGKNGPEGQGEVVFSVRRR